jgi:hypothetical protein
MRDQAWIVFKPAVESIMTSAAAAGNYVLRDRPVHRVGYRAMREPIILPVRTGRGGVQPGTLPSLLDLPRA